MKKKQNYKQKLATDLHDQVDQFDEAISEVVNDLTPSQRVAIELAIKRLKEDLKMVAENVDPPADELRKDCDFVDSFLRGLDYADVPLSESNIDEMVSCIESANHTVIKATNLATQNKVETFLEELKQNPY